MKLHLYFDDPDTGPAKKTSHPNFVKRCRGELFYDCTDEWGPFGNDSGADTLASLEEWYRAPRPRKVMAFIKEQLQEWGFTIPSLGETREATVKRWLTEDGLETQMIEIDQALIAAALGQLKITGGVDRDVLELARAASKRQIIYTAFAKATYVGWEHAKAKAAADKKLLAVLEQM